MTLLDELHSIDLSGVVNARASIRVSIEAPGVKAILEGGAAGSALGDLGRALATIRSGHPDAASLLKPLAEAFVPLVGKLSVDRGAIERYATAVSANAKLIADLVANLALDPVEWKLGGDLSLGQAFDELGRSAEQAAGFGLGNATALRQLLETLDRDVPRDPTAFVDLALKVTASGPALPLRPLRDGVRGALGAVQAIHLPTGRNAGLLAALAAVEQAGFAGDAVALRAALTDLERIRLATIASLSADLTTLLTPVGKLRLETWLRPVLSAIPPPGGVGLGTLDLLTQARAAIVMVRRRIEVFEPDDLRTNLKACLDFLEEKGRLEVELPIDAQVRKLDAWLKALLARNPLRLYRAQLAQAIHAVAQAIADTDLDGPADAVMAKLEELRRALDPDQLLGSVRGALDDVRAQITGALDSVVGALEDAKAAVDAAAGAAVGVVERTTQSAEQFQGSIEAVVTAAEQLGIAEATAQVVAKIAALRETAEKLLSVAPLPEPMRPQVEQLISVIESIDISAALDPIQQTVTAQIRVPEEALAPVKEGLAKLRDVLANLVPEELVKSLEDELASVLAEFRKLDPAALLPDVSSHLDEAAKLLDQLDPRAAAAAVRAPYEKVLAALDAIHPEKLLAPVIEIYDDLLGRIPIPKPDEAVRKLDAVVRQAGERVVEAAAGPMREMLGGGSASGTDSGGPSGGGSGSGEGSSGGSSGGGTANGPPTLEAVRAGDAIRLLGWIPMKLREGLAAMEAGPAGEVLATLDALTAGLAREIRGIRRAVLQTDALLQSQLDTLCEPIARAQLRAQLAIQRGFRANAAGIDVRVSVRAVARASPASLRASLEEPFTRLRQEIGLAAGPGSLAVELERIAARIEQLSIAQATSSLDALLAAFDPEPVAAELDALVATALGKMPAVAAAVDAEIRALVDRFLAIARRFNPMVQAQKFLQILETLRKELDLLDPRRLAAELAEVHAVLRSTILAYDPLRFAEKIHAVLAELAASIRALDPAELLGDLSFLDDILARVEAASPAAALADVDASLEDVGARLAALDPGALLVSLNGLAPKILADLEEALLAIQSEILNLLKALRFATGSASVSVSASVEV